MHHGKNESDPDPNAPAPESGNDKPARKRDLSFIIGTWQEDPAFDEAIAAQDTIDEELWR